VFRIGNNSKSQIAASENPGNVRMRVPGTISSFVAIEICECAGHENNFGFAIRESIRIRRMKGRLRKLINFLG
jgi:hypothetical protein